MAKPGDMTPGKFVSDATEYFQQRAKHWIETLEQIEKQSTKIFCPAWAGFHMHLAAKNLGDALREMNEALEISTGHIHYKTRERTQK